MIELPPATPRPCSDCPWRRSAAPGWLGPLSPEEWTELAHSEQPIACHQTIPPDMGSDGRTDEEKWTETPKLRQCKGAAIFRVNVCKSPRNPTDAEHATEGDVAKVFATNQEFIDYHRPHYERYYEGKR